MLAEYKNQVLDTEQEFICVSRLGHFGKSMAAQMLVAYYNMGCLSDTLKFFALSFSLPSCNVNSSFFVCKFLY